MFFVESIFKNHLNRVCNYFSSIFLMVLTIFLLDPAIKLVAVYGKKSIATNMIGSIRKINVLLNILYIINFINILIIYMFDMTVLMKLSIIQFRYFSYDHNVYSQLNFVINLHTLIRLFPYFNEITILYL